jgi:hypothetical protein
MKHFLKIVLLIMLCLYFAGCQYLTPSWVQGGKVKIEKIEDKDIPAEKVTGEIFRVHIEPAQPLSESRNKIHWFTPEGMKGEK